MSAKFSFCQDCYYNNRSPEICEDCHNGSEFDPIDDDSDFAPASRTKPIKMPKKVKEMQ